MASDAYTVPNVLQMMWQFQQQQAQTGLSQADTQFKQIQAAALKQEMVQQQQNMDADQQFMSAKVQSLQQDNQGDQQALQGEQATQQVAQQQRNLAIQQEVSGPPNASKPNTPSVAEQDNYRLSPIDQEVKEVSSQLKVANQNLQQVQQYARSPRAQSEAKVWEQYRSHLEDKLAVARKEQNTQNEARLKEAANMAANVKTPADIAPFVQNVKDNFGPDVARKVTSQFRVNTNPTPENPGLFLYGPPELAALGRLRDSFVTSAERNTMENQALQRKEAEARIKEQELRDRESEWDHRARIAATQQGIVQREEDKKTAQSQRAISQASTISNNYNNQQPVKDFQAAKSTYTAQEKYLFTGKLGPDGQPEQRPNSAQDSAGDFALVDAYVKLAHPTFKGSVYELKEMKGLAGLPDRAFQAIKNVAVGHELPRDIRYALFNTMRREFKEQNDQQIEREDAALTRLDDLQKYLPPEIQARSYIPTYAIRPDGRDPSKPPPAAAKVQEGAIAVNPTTGERKVLRNGQWQTVQ